MHFIIEDLDETHLFIDAAVGFLLNFKQTELIQSNLENVLEGIDAH